MFKGIRSKAAKALPPILLGASSFLVALPVVAERYTSPSYTIDASTLNDFGVQSSSSSYELVGSGGEDAIGDGSGGSYKLAGGYVAQLEEAAEPSIELYAQPQGLKAYYALDEVAGTTAYDNSAGSNDAMVVNNPTRVESGKVGRAMTFNGIDQYLQAPDSADYPTGNQVKMTVMAWVNQASLVTNKAIASHWNYVTKSGAWALQTINTGGIRVFVASTPSESGNNFASTANNVITAGQWHHVAFTLDGAGATNADKLKVYVDGQPKTLTFNGNIVSNLADPNAALQIGDFQGLSRYWNGSLDEVKIYGRALSATEIKAEYDAQNAGIAAGLTLGSVTPGVSRSSNLDVVTVSNTSGYSLAISQDGNLGSGGYTVPAVSGSIASPVAWSEGATKGLGFTLVSGVGIPGIWNTGNSYAAFPLTPTSFYSRSGYTPGSKDMLGLRVRLDIPNSQVAGNYRNTITITGTATP